MEPPSVLLGAAFPILASPQAWARGGGGGQARGGQVGGKYILNAKQLHLTIWANPLECQTITFDNLEKHIWYLFKKSVSQWGPPTNNGNHIPLLWNQKFPQILCEQLLVEFVFVEVWIGNFYLVLTFSLEVEISPGAAGRKGWKHWKCEHLWNNLRKVKEGGTIES